MHSAFTIASSVHSTTASYRPSHASSSSISSRWVMREVARGTLLAVEKPTMISPEPCAANEPTLPMPRAARLHRRVICEESSGASVATTQMIEPALRTRLSASVNSGSSSWPTGAPLMRSERITPKFDCTSTPSVCVVSPSFTRRELVPIPALKSQVIIPVPAPTEPSATGPVPACSMDR
jgi:hypothetical protein